MSKRADPTPVYISETSATVALAECSDGHTHVTMHDRADPCGNVTDESVPTFREFVVASIGTRDISLRTCTYCGGSL